MKEIGSWLRVNGDAIYNTRPIAPYKSNNICFTEGKDGKVYAIILLSQDTQLQSSYSFTFSKTLKTGSKQILGTKIKAKLKKQDNGYTLTINPKDIVKIKENNALVIKL